MDCEHEHTNNATHDIQVKKISRPHGTHFTVTSGLRICITTTTWKLLHIYIHTVYIYGRGDLVSTVDAFITQMRFILFYFIFYFILFLVSPQCQRCVSMQIERRNQAPEVEARHRPKCRPVTRRSNARVYIRRRKLATTAHEIALCHSLATFYHQLNLLVAAPLGAHFHSATGWHHSRRLIEIPTRR